MQCPACHRSLSSCPAGDVILDVCAGGCGGIWFDNFELRKFDEPDEAQGAALLAIDLDATVEVDHDRPRSCPDCTDIPMMRHYWSAAHRVEIDECPACGGIWLDAGELATIRSLFESEEAARAATIELVHDNFGEELARLDEVDGEVPALPARLGRLFGFLARRPAA